MDDEQSLKSNFFNVSWINFFKLHFLYLKLNMHGLS